MCYFPPPQWTEPTFQWPPVQPGYTINYEPTQPQPPKDSLRESLKELIREVVREEMARAMGS